MKTTVLQPWVTIQGTATGVTSITQDEADYYDAAECSDLHAWIDVRSVSPLASSSITLQLESSPTKDEAFFTPIAVFPLLAASTTPLVVKTASGASSVNPLGRWLRWTLLSYASSGTSGQWGATFRIRVAGAKAPFFSPMMVPGCVRWLRADLGVQLTTQAYNSSAVATWVDQASGIAFTGETVGTANPVLVANGFNGFPAMQTTGTNYFTTTTSLNQAQPNSTLVVAKTSGSLTTVQNILAGSAGGQQNINIPANTTTELGLNAGSLVTPTVGALTNASILQVDWHGSSTQVYQNGSAQGGTVNPGTANNTFTVVAAGSSGTTTFTGYIAEVLMFNQLLTPAWRVLLTRYLGNRYAVSVP